MKYSSRQYAQGLRAALEVVSLKKRGGILNNFVKILRDGKDLKKIRFIEEELRNADREERGEIEVNVWTGMLISSELQKKIRKFIADFLKKDEKKIKTFFEIDKSLLGGFKAKIGDSLIDASVKGMLLKLKRNLK